MKTWTLLFLLALTSCVSAAPPPVIRSPLTTNYPPLSPTLNTPTATTPLTVSGDPASIRFSGTGWSLFANTSESRIGFIWDDNGEIPMYIKTNGQLVISNNQALPVILRQSLQYTTNAGAGKVLSSDVNGVASWSNPPPATAVSISSGAGTGKVLTSDSSGNGSWADPGTAKSDITNTVNALTPGIAQSLLNTNLMPPKGNWAIDYFDDYGASNSPPINGGVGWRQPGIVKGSYDVVLRTNTAGQTENRLRIRNGEYGRTMPWGHNWKKVRVAVLWLAATNVDFTNVASFGFCFGTNKMFGSSTTCSNWFGHYYGTQASGTNPTPATFQYSNIPPGIDYTWFNNNVVRSGFITNGSWVATTFSGTCESQVPAQALGVAYFEITRPQFMTTNSYVYGARGQGKADTTPPTIERDAGRSQTLYDLPSTPTGSPVFGPLQSTTATITQTYNENFGPLDTVNIYWAHPGIPVEISMVAVYRVY